LIIYTGGTFDLFHAGHVNFLAQCSQFGEVVVSLNTDDFIAKYKGNAPICSYAEREEVLQACRYVSDVVPNEGGADSKLAILNVSPDVIAIGSDWARKDYHGQMGFTQDWLDSHNISLMYIPYTEHISTTVLKERLASRSRL
jgi:glycerol-3-phosphate cytidylyltransferase